MLLTKDMNSLQITLGQILILIWYKLKAFHSIGGGPQHIHQLLDQISRLMGLTKFR